MFLQKANAMIFMWVLLISTPFVFAAPASFTISEPEWVVPGPGLPSEVLPQASNNNMAIAAHEGRLYMAWRTAPNHFASSKAVLYVVSTPLFQDGERAWEMEAQFALGADVREPNLLSYRGNLFLYFFEGGTNPLQFEPKHLWRSERRGARNWTTPSLWGEPGMVAWEMKVRGGTAWMTSYVGGHYSPGKSEVRVGFWNSHDGVSWNPVRSDRAPVYVGGVSEVGFEFDLQGDLWGVTRKVPETRQIPILILLDEYISHLYVQHLHLISFRAAEAQASCASLASQLELLQKKIDSFRDEEAQHRRENLADVFRAEEKQQFEKVVLRISQLKKFFQSDTFIETEKKATVKKINEPAAALGAAIAGTWAAAFDRLNRPDWVDFGFRGVFIICFGVAAYVLRDRLKDQFKNILAKKATQILADVEHHLFAEEKKLGRIREWFSFTKDSRVIEAARNLRRTARVSEVEFAIPEDIFHYRKVQQLQTGTFEKEGSLAFQEILRINLDRYLRYMDDPFKDVSLLDPEGQLCQLKSHRVYYFYLAVCSRYTQEHDRHWLKRGLRKGLRRFRRSAPTKRQELNRIYRIVMDKTGVDRIEAVGAVEERISSLTRSTDEAPHLPLPTAPLSDSMVSAHPL